MSNTLVVLLGPTGVGKTKLSIDIAKALNCEIISSDSRQFFHELRIGTAVPEVSELQEVPHHFIHHKSIFDYYNASQFEYDVLEVVEKLFQKNNFSLMVGGSGMYIDAVCKGIDEIPDVDMELRDTLVKRIDKEGIESLRLELKMLDPEFYSQADLSNSQRILRALEVCIQTGKTFTSFRLKEPRKRNFNIIKIGLNCDREILYSHINLRVDKMMSAGLLDEAISVFPHKGIYALKTVGYKELFSYMEGDLTLENAVELIKQNTRNYARRQLTWFRRDKEINWFQPHQKQEILKFLQQ